MFAPRFSHSPAPHSPAPHSQAPFIGTMAELAQLAASRRRSKLVLCVDDDRSIRDIVKHCLKEAGYPVLNCRDGELALTMLTRFQPSIVLLDIDMPELDGVQTLAEMRRRFPDLRPKVVFLTGRRSIDDLRSAKSVGGDDYMIKPFTRANLVRRVDRWAGLI
jgi:DNA-binding response OmpR family regulator